ncbi:MAG TPA: SpoIIE family protein phosphatase [Thermoanaerobaculaceae bacterium]|nr:SpoIIE family protein phosphatase [Thermoanaerobaculaceae bacterium]
MTQEQTTLWGSAPVLTPREQGGPGARVRVAQPTLRVGRDPSCDVVIYEPTVSRKHAKLSWDGHELVVEDLGSSGGTFVNEQRVQRSAIKPGDVLRLGPRIEYVVQLEATSTPLEIAASASSSAQRGAEGGVRNLQMLLDVARALNAATVLEEVVEIVLQAAVRLVKAERGAVILIEPGGKRSTVAHYPRELAETAWGEQSSLLERAMKERRTVNTGMEISPSTSMVMRGASMAVATPMIVARRPVGKAEDASFIATMEVIGGVVVERARLAEGFGREETAVLESVAAEAAVAIDSARLYRESREKAKIDYEMSLARTIQTALLRKPPETGFAEVFAFSQPARSVGGDLYHGVLRADGGLAVALGDVSGKGVGAALIMAMAQGLLGMLHELGRPVEEMLPALNRNLNQYNPGNRFLTLGLGVLHPDGRLLLGNAGHCPIALLRANGEVEMRPPHGPVLGILPMGTWGVDALQLQHDDKVVFYSDGISESFSPTNEEFGVDGVQRCLTGLGGRSAESAGKTVLEAAAAFRAGREAEDDVTLLAVRYKNRP